MLLYPAVVPTSLYLGNVLNTLQHAFVQSNLDQGTLIFGNFMCILFEACPSCAPPAMGVAPAKELQVTK